MSIPEACPVDPIAAQRELWRLHGEARATIKDMVDPMADVVAYHAVLMAGQADFNERLDANKQPIAHGMPFGGELGADPYTLPPFLFGVGDSARATTLPETDAARQALVEAFLADRTRILEAHQVTGISMDKDATHRALLGFRLRELYKSGTQIDPAKWSAYVDGAMRQVAGGHYRLELAGQHRARATETLLENPNFVELANSPVVGRVESFSYRANRSLIKNLASGDKVNTLTGFIHLPDSEYGSEFTGALLESAEVMIASAGGLTTLASELAAGNEDVIATYMARARKSEGCTPAEALVVATQEGVISVVQAIALLTKERVPGYDDPVQLVRDIVDKGLVERLTRALPVGVIGTFTLSGLYFPGLLQNGPDGLTLNPETMSVLKEIRTREAMILMTKLVMYKDVVEGDSDIVDPLTMGVFCPATDMGGGIAGMSRGLAAGLQARLHA